MVDTKLVLLVKRLNRATVDGLIHWEKTIVEFVYHAAFGRYVIELFSRDNIAEADALDYVLRIYDEDGKVIEEVTDVDLAASFESEEAAYKVMRDTYFLARRSAEGVDEAIDSILKELTQIERQNIPF